MYYKKDAYHGIKTNWYSPGVEICFENIALIKKYIKSDDSWLKYQKGKRVGYYIKCIRFRPTKLFEKKRDMFNILIGYENGWTQIIEQLNVTTWI